MPEPATVHPTYDPDEPVDEARLAVAYVEMAITTLEDALPILHRLPPGAVTRVDLAHYHAVASRFGQAAVDALVADPAANG